MPLADQPWTKEEIVRIFAEAKGQPRYPFGDAVAALRKLTKDAIPATPEAVRGALRSLSAT